MIHWTELGAVAAPAVVDIDAEGWSAEELAAELHYWVVERRGPRSAACTAAVLRGASAAIVAAVLPDARRAGLERVGVWALPGEAEEAAACGIDLLNLDVARAHEAVDAVPVAVRCDIGDVSTAFFEKVRPERLGRALCIVDAAHASTAQVGDAASRLAAVPGWWWRGWPVCGLPADLRAVLPTPNRWRVTGGRRRAQATLTQPQIDRFFRADACRFCAARACAGAPWDAWRRGEIPALRPVDDASTRGVPARYETLLDVAG